MSHQEINIAVVIKNLRLFNDWRRGDEKIEQPNPAEIGKSIDEACEKLDSLQRERDEAREEVASLRLEAKYHDEADALRKLRERERDEAREAIKNYYKAKGRYNSQIAAARMFELVGLPTEYPKVGGDK